MLPPLSTFIKSIVALVMIGANVPHVVQTAHHDEKAVCYRTTFSNWSFVNAAFNPRDVRFKIAGPSRFEAAQTFRLSERHASESANHYLWKTIPPDSVTVWSTFAMEGFSFRAVTMGSTIHGEFIYMHDSYPDRKAELVGYRIDCARGGTNVITALNEPRVR